MVPGKVFLNPDSVLTFGTGYTYGIVNLLLPAHNQLLAGGAADLFYSNFHEISLSPEFVISLILPYKAY